jgi:hypothetical protein
LRQCFNFILIVCSQGDVEIEDLDNRLSNIESGENLVKCNEPEPVDMQEVNELMNEMSDFDDESEETSDLIEERLAKTINKSLRENISESKFKETKSKSLSLELDMIIFLYLDMSSIFF